MTNANEDRPRHTAIVAPTQRAFQDILRERNLSPQAAIWLHSKASSARLRGLSAVNVIWGPGASHLSADATKRIMQDLAVIRAIGQVTEEHVAA